MAHSALSLEALAMNFVLRTNLKTNILNRTMQRDVATWKNLEGRFMVVKVKQEVDRRDGGNVKEEHRDFCKNKKTDYLSFVEIPKIGDKVSFVRDGSGWLFDMGPTDTVGTGIVFEVYLDGCFSIPGGSTLLPNSEDDVFETETVVAGGLRKSEWVRWKRPGGERQIWSQELNTLRLDKKGRFEWRSKTPVYYQEEDLELEITWTWTAVRLSTN